MWVAFSSVSALVGSSFGMPYAFASGHKALRVCGDLIQKLRLKVVALFHEGFDLFFDVCVFFLADGERAHHVAQRRAECGNECPMRRRRREPAHWRREP